MTNRTLGKDKAPICIELNKLPLDPAFVEEMKMVRYAILIFKVKTILEKEYQNDPNCNVSGLKDEQGREIDMAEEEDEKSNEEDEGETDDVEDADDENDDDDDDDNDNSGNDSDNGADPTYDSESPLLVGPDYDTVPERFPTQKSPSNSDDTREASQQDEDVSTDHPEDLSRALVPHVQPMDETPIKREEAVVRGGILEASPILLSSASGGKKDAPLQENQVNTPQTNIEDESPPVSPRNVMNLMRDTVHAAEITHQQYLTLRQRDTEVLENLSKKELHELHTAVNKVARQQHKLKHSHYSLKERVNLACSKIETSQDNTYQLGQYALQILGYAQNILNAVNKLSTVPPTTCADDAKKGEKRNHDDKDDDHPRENTRERSPSHTPRDYGQRSTKPSYPPSKSRGHHPSQSRHYSNRGHSQPRSQSFKPRQSYGSESKFVFTGLSKREKTNRRQKLMKNNKTTSHKHPKRKNQETKQRTMEKHEEEARKREHELEERERVKKLIEDLTKVTKHSEHGVIYNAAFKVHAESGKIYREGMNSFELISWWKAGVIAGANIREAYNNYISLNTRGKYEDLVRTNPIKIFRERINKEIDTDRMLKQQEEREIREREEAKL
ncbi:PREDICTED: uncharacterized protein LOC109174258 [Ipomoea nil]|uniref:uncharacterized protein LOC109174258 n=1 Tax=Ipomoea nil TaxID=35883 RepID=UPI0009017AA2|nr:PREDICTED: uncharacterized protein LOC109174258 [Ipomoea nil]